MNAQDHSAAYRRIGAGLLIVGVVLGAVGAVSGFSLIGAGSSASAAEETSAIVQKWADGGLAGERDPEDPDYAVFEDLEVGVSQSEHLSDQGVVVSWTGAKATSQGDFATNYLQIMQCWGDDAESGPAPEQCQFGASTASLNALLGTGAASRSLSSRGSDPKQSYDDDVYRLPTNPSRPNARSYAVPFLPVSGERVFDTTTYFTAASTNEVDAVRTGSDGSGLSVFQLQSSLSAPHLGCGASLPDGGIRSCWLVVVPRGESNTTGQPATANQDGRLTGSPLSQSAWDNRMVFPMSFTPTTASCTIGSQEVRIVGNEEFTEAMTSYQAAICPQGTTLGYSQLGDDESRGQLLSASSGSSSFAAVADPLTKAQQGSTKVEYAPIAQNAIVFGYNIDRDFRSGSSREDRNGTPVTNLTLNARLVAKLLTQSYRVDVPGGGSTSPLTENPYTIVRDPEFTELNPEFAEFQTSATPEGLIVSFGSSDDIAQVWDWIKADPQAAGFLEGRADDWGMRINPVYQGLAIVSDASINSFPKADLTVVGADAALGAPGYGTLDLRPYAQDFAESAYRAARGDAGAKFVWDPTRTPAQYVSGGAQLPGKRFELAVTTRSSAERYGLNMAKIVNGAGQAVAPTDESITAAIGGFTASETSKVAKVPDPQARTLDAYPLATVTHAAIALCSADARTRDGYASLLDHLSGIGQIVGHEVGRLPVGYVPLSGEQISVVKKLSALLRDAKAVAKECPDEKASEPEPEAEPEADPDTETGSDDDALGEPIDSPDAPGADEPEASGPGLHEGVTDHETAGARGVALGISAALGVPALLGGSLLMRKGAKGRPTKI